jgi:hypothetical protein
MDRRVMIKIYRTFLKVQKCFYNNRDRGDKLRAYPLALSLNFSPDSTTVLKIISGACRLSLLFFKILDYFILACRIERDREVGPFKTEII